MLFLILVMRTGFIYETNRKITSFLTLCVMVIEIVLYILVRGERRNHLAVLHLLDSQLSNLC